MKRHRIWGTAAAVVTGLTGVLIFQGATGGADGPNGTDAKPEPVKAKAYSQQLLTNQDGSAASLGRHDVKPFSMLGMTWTDPGARITGNVEVRTRDVKTGQWSQWLRLDGDSGQGENGAARGGTESA